MFSVYFSEKVELKGCLVEADWDFVALSEQH